MNLETVAEFRSWQDYRKWKVEIKNSFIRVNGRRISNGPIESTNSKIKQLLKQNNGISFYVLKQSIIF